MCVCLQRHCVVPFAPVTQVSPSTELWFDDGIKSTVTWVHVEGSDSHAIVLFEVLYIGPMMQGIGLEIDVW
jgi:hypothetical protein